MEIVRLPYLSLYRTRFLSELRRLQYTKCSSRPQVWNSVLLSKQDKIRAPVNSVFSREFSTLLIIVGETQSHVFYVLHLCIAMLV